LNILHDVIELLKSGLALVTNIECQVKESVAYIKENEMGGPCSKHGREARCIQCSDKKPEGKRPLGRSSI
jgi:hypothetical protein